nr:hypothetical protein B0A51_10969 [Rachicladosporium sp. CCFEE 5018]
MRHGPSYGASLGGRYWYDDVTDTIIRENGPDMPRPAGVSIATLTSSIAGGSAQPRTPSKQTSSSLEGPWHSPGLGGQYMYDRQADQFVSPDGRRVQRPSTIARPSPTGNGGGGSAGSSSQTDVAQSPAKSPIHFNVYTAEYAGRPNHVAVFVETQESGGHSGRLFQVVGSVVRGGGGMRYEDKRAHNPVDSHSYAEGSLRKIGIVAQADLGRFRAICQAVPVPGPQLNLNSTLIDKSKPLRRCIEWTAEAVLALQEAGVLHSTA